MDIYDLKYWLANIGKTPLNYKKSILSKTFDMQISVNRDIIFIKMSKFHQISLQIL